MRPVTIARNYAEALFELAERHGATERFGDLIDAVAAAFETTPAIRSALVSPRVPKQTKMQLLAQALRDAPRPFVLFLQALVKRGRVQLVREIATEYLALVDVKLNRLRVGVTLARPGDEALRRVIEERLSRAFGKQVIANLTVDPAVLGGAVVRVREQVFDGSVRRRMARLRRQLLASKG